MKNLKILHKIILFSLFVFTPPAFAGEEIKLFMKSQSGNHRDPYYAIYLLDKKKRYVKTIAILGSDRQYYNSLKYWWRHFNRGSQKIDAITGASLKNGDTHVQNVILPKGSLDGNHHIRISSVAENGGYISKEIVLKLTDKNNDKKKRGKKYVRNFVVKW